MHIKDFTAAIETLAPLESAIANDNPGLLVGTERAEIKRVLVALDCTCQVVDEAIKLNADMVLSHHPLMYHPVRRILPDSPATAAIFKLVRNDIALYAAHTNLDAAQGGVNTALCRMLGIEGEVAAGSEGIMRIGSLCKEMMLFDFARHVENRLNTRVRISGDNRAIRRVAAIGGTGGNDAELAFLSGADVLVTGECKHSEAIAASVYNFPIIVAGHYETESVVLLPLIEYLRTVTTGVEYILSNADKATLRTL